MFYFKNHIMKTQKFFSKQILLFSALVFAFMFTQNIYAQEESETTDFNNLEKLQDQNEDYMFSIYKISEKYPEFSYECNYDKDMDVTHVIIKGVDNTKDKEELKTLIAKLEKNKSMMKNVPTRTGIYYCLDNVARYKGGDEALYQTLNNNLMYPDDAKQAGVGGTVYVKFVIDNTGNISYINTATDISSPYKDLVQELKQEAINDIKKTSGHWLPAKVDGKPVSSWALVPITFKFESDPTMPVLIR